MKMQWMLPVLLVVILLASGCVSQDEVQTSTSGQTEPTGDVKVFEMTAKQFSFEPNIITVKKGDTVKLAITSVDVAHGLSLPDFGVNENLEPGKTVNVEFVADKTGTFSFFCSVPCGSGHNRMSGQLIIE